MRLSPFQLQAKRVYIYGWYEGDIKIENLENKNYVLKAKWGEYEYEQKEANYKMASI